MSFCFHFKQHKETVCVQHVLRMRCQLLREQVIMQPLSMSPDMKAGGSAHCLVSHTRMYVVIHSAAQLAGQLRRSFILRGVV